MRIRIIFFSPKFFPSVGGLENVVRDWAYGLTEAGHKVQVVTLTSSERTDDFPFEVFRNIGFWKTLILMRKADVVIQFNVSLKGILPCILSFRPLIISQHTTNLDIKGRWTPYGKIKHFIANHIAKANTACSYYVAAFFNNVTVIHSPYNAEVFTFGQNVERNSDIAFLGRLVSDKGCDVLIRALQILGENFCLFPSVTIIGDGPEKRTLINLAEELKLKNHLLFSGKIEGEELAEVLNHHKILVVPSVWEEPFGIVALEGLACGCRVVVSNAGGLPESVGSFGLKFKKGDADDLSKILKEVLMEGMTVCREELQLHLKEFTVEASVTRLIQVLNKVL